MTTNSPVVRICMTLLLIAALSGCLDQDATTGERSSLVQRPTQNMPQPQSEDRQTSSQCNDEGPSCPTGEQHFERPFNVVLNFTGYYVEADLGFMGWSRSSWAGMTLPHPENATPIRLTATFEWTAGTPLSEHLQTKAFVFGGGGNITAKANGTSPLELDFDARSHAGETTVLGVTNAAPIGAAYREEVRVFGTVTYEALA